NGVIVPCIRISRDEDFKRYGIVSGQSVRGGVIKMDRLVEKPGREQAPSDLASVGGYLLTPDVYEYVERGLAQLHDKEEFYLTTYALQPLIENGRPLYACE